MSPQTAISGKELWFRYAQDGADVVRGLTLTVQRGEFLALLGGKAEDDPENGENGGQLGLFS